MNTVYIISGPLGVGKSSVTKELVNALPNSSLIEGDVFLHQLNPEKIPWEERLKLSWDKILSATKDILDKNQDVVIDFVVEDELPWFIKELSPYSIQLKYVVLVAETETLKERLNKRNEIRYIDRSLILLEQLSKDPNNKKHLYNTESKEVKAIVQDVISADQFIV